MNKKIKKVAVPAAALVLVGAIGGITASQLAYLTDSETATNTFTVGKVAVDLEEPNYPGNGSDEVTNLVPNEQVPKDPQVENTGDNKMVSFLKVYSPVALVSTVNDDGTAAQTLGPNEIFWLKSKNSNEDPADLTQKATHKTGFDKNWVELTAKETDEGKQYFQAQDQADGSIKYASLTSDEAEAALWAAKFYHAVPQTDGSILMQSIAAEDIKNLPAYDPDKIETKVFVIEKDTIAKTKEAFNQAKTAQFHYANAAAVGKAGFVEVSRDAEKKAEEGHKHEYKTDKNYQQRLDNARIFKSYVFGYKDQIEPKVTTNPIFNAVQLKNIIEGEIDTRTQKIAIETYAIQSENIIASGAEVTPTNMNATTLGTVYDIFVNQKTAGKGDEAQSDLYKNVESQDANITPSKDLNGNMADKTTKRIEISIDKAKIEINKSQTITATASTNGVKETNPTGITYTSGNTAIATVGEDGKVTGVALGTTFITAKWQGAEAKIEVTVVNPAETSAPTPAPTPGP